MELKGQIEVAFKIKNEADLHRLMAFCQEFKAAPVITKHPRRERPSTEARRLTKRESQDRIIAMLKETFKEGFTMRDATAKVFEKLDLRETTARHAITRAKKEGTLLQRGRIYVWTEVVQQRVIARQQQEKQQQQLPPAAQQQTPIAAEPLAVQ